jgi:hypothetical protein
MHEELIISYANTPDKEEELERCVSGYIEYAEDKYPPPPYPDPMELWTYRNYLGFGLGSQMSGHPYGRHRTYIEPGGHDCPKSVTMILDNVERATELDDKDGRRDHQSE